MTIKISLLDLLQVIVENLRILILAPLGVGILALGISFFIPPSFTANTAFLPQQQASAAASMLLSLGAIGGIACAAAEIKDLADQYVAFLQSRAVQDALIKRFDLQERYQQDFQESTRKTLAGNEQNFSRERWTDHDRRGGRRSADRSRHC